MSFNSPFKSKKDGMDRAKKHHLCLDCRHWQYAIYKKCPKCGSKNRQKFDSKAEFQRGQELLLLQDTGHLSGLRFQPKYPLWVNDKQVAVYTADAEYVRTGEEATTTEDTKPEDFIDKYAKLKMELFQTIYERTIYIPQRASGSMA